jgi:hypothetical protein
VDKTDFFNAKRGDAHRNHWALERKIKLNFAHRVYLRLYDPHKKVIIYSKFINQLHFIIAIHSVFCGVETGLLNTICTKSDLKKANSKINICPITALIYGII